MKVLLLCCTYNRHACLEKVVRFYLDQDYKGESVLFIYNNSPSPLQLDYLNLNPRRNQTIILKNNHLDLYTGEKYKYVGDIHRDALHFAEEEVENIDVISFYEDDNYYLRNHLSAGVAGMTTAYAMNQAAYKPAQSYWRSELGICLKSATFEPSFFIDFRFLKRHGFKRFSSVDFHYSWITPLQELDMLFVDINGEPTLIYNWFTEGVIHLSARYNNGTISTEEHRRDHIDIGDGIITPVSREEAVKCCYSLLPPKQTMINRLVNFIKTKTG
jgi:hypothetical protein